ncbi:gp53-like domain-containing protein [Megasphaera jansseni]
MRQWGYAYTVDGVYRTATLPISFSAAVLRCVATMAGLSDDTTDVTIIWNDQQTTISQVQFRINGTTAGSPTYFIVGR